MFQQNIEKSLLPTTYYYRLKDSAGAWSHGENARFTPSNLCDYVIFCNGSLYMTEAKSTKGKSIPFGNFRASQIKGYKKLEKKREKVDNLYGLFLIEFSELKETYAVYSGTVVDYMTTTDRKSIPVDWLKKEGVKLEIREGKRKQVKIEEGIKELKERSGK